MNTADYCWVMTDYNAWMNQRLFDLCRSIDDVGPKSDRGAFFGSIHATLNHTLYGDLAFRSRFTRDPAVVPALAVDVPDNFDDLWR